MPSTKSPLATVLPGPGRLPANTVPANALIFPPGGGSDAALQAHITDPVDAHMASAIGQTSYTGETWSIPANGVQSALTKLFDGTNARPVWVLDANPANKADFVGATALMDAIAAIIPGTQPQIYLRSGVYNWTDAAAISNCTIIGATTFGASSAIIQNLAGDLRVGLFATFRNVTITLSGKLKVSGFFGLGLNVFEAITLNVTGDIEVSCGYNTFRTLSESFIGPVPAYIHNISGSNNVFENLRVAQIKESGQLNNYQGVTTLDPKYPADPALWVTGSYNSFDTVLIASATMNSGSVFQIDGDQNSFNELQLLSAAPLTPAKHVVSISGNRNTVTGIDVSSAVFPAAAISLFSFTGSNNDVSGVKIVAVNSGLATSPLIDIGANFNEVSNVAITGSTVGINVVNITGIHNKLSRFDLSANTIGGTAMININANSAKNALLDNILITGNTSPGVPAVKVTGSTLDLSNQIVIRDANFEGVDSSTSNGILVSACGSAVIFHNVHLQTLVSGAIGTTEAFSVTDSRYVTATDCTIEANGGRAGHFANSGVVLERCSFIGGSVGAGTGKQLFHGYGHNGLIYTGAPLIIRDCTMIVGTANINTTTGTTPIVFLGGQDANSVSQHGPVDVDGLILTSATSGMTWHHATTLAIDIANASVNARSAYRNITIDLNSAVWANDGTGSSVYGTIDTFGTVLEIEGPLAGQTRTLQTKLAEIFILRAKTDAAATKRHMVKAVGCLIDGLIIDGAPVPGTGNFGTECIVGSGIILNNLDLFPSSGFDVGANYFVSVISSIIDKANMRNFLTSGTAPIGAVGLLTSQLLNSFFGVTSGLQDFTTLISSTGASKILNNSLNIAGNGTNFDTFITCTGFGYDIVDANIITSSNPATGTSAIEYIRTSGISYASVTNNKLAAAPGIVRINGSATGTAVTNAFTLTDGVQNFTSAGAQIGDLVIITAGAVANLGTYRVVAVTTAHILTLDRPTPGGAPGVTYSLYQGGTGVVRLVLENAFHCQANDNNIVMSHGGMQVFPSVGFSGNIVLRATDNSQLSISNTVSDNSITDLHSVGSAGGLYGGFVCIEVVNGLGNTVTGNAIEAVTANGLYPPTTIILQVTGGAVTDGYNTVISNALNGFGSSTASTIANIGNNPGFNVVNVPSGPDPLNAIL